MSEKPIHPELAAVLSEIELSFFRRGEPDAPPTVETFEDLDEGYQRPRFWSRVFNNQRPASEPLPLVVAAHASLVVEPAVHDEDEDEEWQWKIRIARARAATGG
jgi:hypothetical protein